MITPEERLSYLGRLKPTALDRLSEVIDFDYFRELLDEHLDFKVSTKGGRPRWDCVLMFKILVLQKYYSLSEEETEFQILDRYSFQRFLGLDAGKKVPDKNTIWLFKERLGVVGMDALFDAFNSLLKEAGLLASKGKIVDASFVDVPRQRNSKEDNAAIKSGNKPVGFATQPPAHQRQKDLDARWMTKNRERHYGYKNHIKINAKTKLIERYGFSDASVHDSQKLEALLDEEDGSLWADSAYSGAPLANKLKALKIRNHIHEKGYRGHPLSKAQKARNTTKSKTRVRVEHVFGFQKMNMNADWIRTIGKHRAHFQIGLSNFIYNLHRMMQLGYCMQ